LRDRNCWGGRRASYCGDAQRGEEGGSLAGGAADVVVAPDAHDFSDEVNALTDSAGADVVIDTVGSRVFMPAFKSLGVCGRYGDGRATVPRGYLDQPRPYFLQRGFDHRCHQRARDQLEDTVRLVATGIVHPRVAKIYRLEEAAAAHNWSKPDRMSGASCCSLFPDLTSR